MDTLLVQLSQSVSAAKSLEELVRPLLEMLEAVTGLEATALTTIDMEKGIQQVQYAHNPVQRGLPEGAEVPWAFSLCRRALEKGLPYDDHVADCWDEFDLARQVGVQTFVSVLVTTDDGAVYGSLCGSSTRQVPMATNAMHVLQLFSRLIGQHVDREKLLVRLAQANGELAALALTDVLTGLPNRRAAIAELKRALARAERDGSWVVVGFVDLDGFKAINDRHGHEAGDQFLTAMARSLSNGLRAGDVLARFGGDEFVLVGPGPLRGDPAAGAVVTQFQQRLAELSSGCFPVAGIDVDYPGASVGVVLVDPSASDAEASLHQADAAMYEVKRLRRGTADS